MNITDKVVREAIAGIKARFPDLRLTTHEKWYRLHLGRQPISSLITAKEMYYWVQGFWQGHRLASLKWHKASEPPKERYSCLIVVDGHVQSTPVYLRDGEWREDVGLDSLAYPAEQVSHYLPLSEVQASFDRIKELE